MHYMPVGVCGHTHGHMYLHTLWTMAGQLLSVARVVRSTKFIKCLQEKYLCVQAAFSIVLYRKPYVCNGCSNLVH